MLNKENLQQILRCPNMEHSIHNAAGKLLQYSNLAYRKDKTGVEVANNSK